jgi:hypothetical protein
VIETWKRTNDQEPTPDLPHDLLYHPLTGDGDFQWLSLEDRLKELLAYHRSLGFSDGFHAGRSAAMDAIEGRITEMRKYR